MFYPIYLFFVLLALIPSCESDFDHKNTDQHLLNVVNSNADTSGSGILNIRTVFHDSKGKYWFGSDTNGLYTYDDSIITHFDLTDGLPGRQIRSIQEDVNGFIWIDVGGKIVKYDGKVFRDLSMVIKNAPYGKLNFKTGGLIFDHSDGICYYDGRKFTNFTIKPKDFEPPKYNNIRPYCLYSWMADSKGNVWFGTESKGVAKYDGKDLTWITGKGLEVGAVRAIYEDKSGKMWFGNSGRGLFTYDGHELNNLSEENGLGNPNFGNLYRDVALRIEKFPSGIMSSIMQINEDNNGNIWIGTYMEGIWKYDGKKFINYWTKHGLSGNSVMTVYPDKEGKFWFGIFGEEICIFNDQSRVGQPNELIFKRFTIQ